MTDVSDHVPNWILDKCSEGEATSVAWGKVRTSAFSNLIYVWSRLLSDDGAENFH